VAAGLASWLANASATGNPADAAAPATTSWRRFIVEDRLDGGVVMLSRSV
jgi:hypothetical protein